jgi:hypothetical protein
MVFLNLTSIDFSATSNYRNSLQAEMAARAGLDYAIYVLNMDKYGTDSVVYNNNAYSYTGTTTQGYDEGYDAYTEEWLGTGTGKIFGTSTVLTIANAVDNNGAGTVTSPWLDMPCALDRGLRAQYAILIEDVGESRININATGNIGTASGNFVYGTGATTFDIRLQDILGNTTATNIILGTTAARCMHGTPGTDASHYQPRNPTGTDSPYNVLDAADLCFGTYTQPGTYKSRLRNIINNEARFLNVRNNLTMYSFDPIIADNGVATLVLSDNKNYYRLKLDNSSDAGSITAQLQIAGFSQGTATQLAVHIKDYLDTDTDITSYGTPTKYGLEPHPFINELYHTGTNSTQPRQNLIELYNPFNTTIGSSTMSINGSKMELVLKITKTEYERQTGTVCTWTVDDVTTTLCPIGTANFSIQPNSYTILGYGTQNTVVSLSGTQTVTGFDIYDYDSEYIPRAVTVTLMGSSSALSGGNYLILDEVQPNAYTNSIRSEDVLWLLYKLIEYVYDKTHAVGNTTQETQAFQSLLNRSGEGLWDGSLGTLEVDHTSSQSGNNALERLTVQTTLLGVQGGPQVWIVAWSPGSTGVNDAIDELEALISATSGNAQIDAGEETTIIDYAQDVIDLLNDMLCAGTLNIRASIGERKNPLIERSDNWGTATTHTLGGTNTSYGSVTASQRKQLVVANKNMISLGELGHLLSVGYGTQSSYTSNALYATSGTNTVDSAKLDLGTSPATLIPNYFTILDPKNDAIDDDADGAIGTDTGLQADDIDGPEIQVPGRININTAASSVLAALPGTSAGISFGSWSATIGSVTGSSLINNIINARPISTVGTITTVTGMDYFGSDTIDNDGDGLVDEKDEKDLIYTAISNLITTHSNVFAVHVTARIVNSDASQTFATRKLVAIVDRSVTPVKIRYFRWMTEW